jgi:hypothetical protein
MPNPQMGGHMMNQQHPNHFGYPFGGGKGNSPQFGPKGGPAGNKGTGKGHHGGPPLPGALGGFGEESGNTQSGNQSAERADEDGDQKVIANATKNGGANNGGNNGTNNTSPMLELIDHPECGTSPSGLQLSTRKIKPHGESDGKLKETRDSKDGESEVGRDGGKVGKDGGKVLSFLGNSALGAAPLPSLLQSGGGNLLMKGSAPGKVLSRPLSGRSNASGRSMNSNLSLLINDMGLNFEI